MSQTGLTFLGLKTHRMSPSSSPPVQFPFFFLYSRGGAITGSTAKVEQHNSEGRASGIAGRLFFLTYSRTNLPLLYYVKDDGVCICTCCTWHLLTSSRGSTGETKKRIFGLPPPASSSSSTRQDRGLSSGSTMPRSSYHPSIALLAVILSELFAVSGRSPPASAFCLRWLKHVHCTVSARGGRY